MTIRHMKIFVSVYQAQSITRAAEQLHMTQPAVSRAIPELEPYSGVCLFERIGRRLHEPSFVGKFPAGRRESGQRDPHIFQSVAFRPPHQNVRGRSRQYRPSQGKNE